MSNIHLPAWPLQLRHLLLDGLGDGGQPITPFRLDALYSERWHLLSFEYVVPCVSYTSRAAFIIVLYETLEQ
jgi:hypothetical protein